MKEGISAFWASMTRAGEGQVWPDTELRKREERTPELGSLSKARMAGSGRSSLLTEQTGKLPATALEAEVGSLRA